MAKNGTSILEWNAPEHEHKERSSDWFWSVGIISIAISIVSIIIGNIIFGILILVSAFSLALFINRKPEDTHVLVNEKGIQDNKIFYPFETLSEFWIDTEHPHKKIILESKKALMPLIVVPIGDEVDTNKLRSHLENYLKEEYHSLPLVEKILEYFGF